MTLTHPFLLGAQWFFPRPLEADPDAVDAGRERGLAVLQQQRAPVVELRVGAVDLVESPPVGPEDPHPDTRRLRQEQVRQDHLHAVILRADPHEVPS